MRTNNGTHTIHKKRNEITLKVSLISFNSILITCGACHFTLKLNVTHFVFSSALLLLENFRAETSSVHISRGALTIPFQRLLFIDVYIMNFSLGCQLCAAQITLIYIHTNSCCFFSFLPFAHRFVYHFFLFFFFSCFLRTELFCSKFFSASTPPPRLRQCTLSSSPYKHTLVVFGSVRSFMSFICFRFFFSCVFCALRIVVDANERICLIVLCTEPCIRSLCFVFFFFFTISQTVIIRIVLHFCVVALCAITFICTLLRCTPDCGSERYSHVRMEMELCVCSVCAFE